MPVRNESSELRIIRVYDAPLQAVWEAWTDPEQAAKWWGPRGFSLTSHAKELRAGGHWDYTMHGPDGTDYPNITRYLEVEPHAKLVYDHGGSADRPPLFRVTVFFSESNGNSKMDMCMTLPSPEEAEEARKFIKKAGGDATWDRLAEYLAKQRSGKEQFVINRTFEAPLELMYELWTKPEHVSQWTAPTGFEMQFLEAEIKPGGRSFYVMTGKGGLKMYGRVEYLEFEKPHRIAYRQQFSDEHGGIARYPMAPTWPETMQTVVTLTAESPDRTRVTVTWEPYGEVLTEERETFIKARGGMTQGWTGSFDKLEAYIAEP